MGDRRIHKTISGRYDKDVLRRVDPLRPRRFATWLACLAGMLGAAVLLLGSRRSFEARPVSPAHRLFEQDCAACHQQPFGTVGRLLSLDNGKRTVDDESCRKCHHGKESRDHYAGRFEGEVTLHGTADCAECHHEHGHSGRLSLVDDQHCTKCHESLKDRVAGHVRKSTDVRAVEQEASSFAEKHPKFDRATAAGRQKFRFNHALHLDVRGLPKSDGGSETLNCSSCHRTDGSGAYMRAISFAEHCERCHQLHVSDQLSPVLVEGGLATPLPHAAPEELHGVLRGRLMRHAEQAFGKPVPAVSLPPPLTYRPRSSSAKDKWEWVEEQLKFAESQLLNAPETRTPEQPPRADAALKMMCNVCHETSPSPAPINELVNWQIEKPGIPVRWLEHGRFPHNRHADLRCIDCHYKQAPVDKQFPEITETHLKAYYQTPQGDFPAFLRDTIYASALPDNDVLIPDIDACRKCHGTPELSNATGSAPSNCVSCHDYHHSPHGISPQGNEHPGRILPFLTSERVDQ